MIRSSATSRRQISSFPTALHLISRARIAFLALSLMIFATGCEALFSNDRAADASGFIEARSYSLASESGGTVNSVLVEPGDAVAAGDALLTLDTSGLESARAQVAAGVRAAQAALEEIQDRPSESDLLLAEATLSEAVGKLDAAEAALALLLAGYGAVDPPDSELHAAEAAIEIAEAGVALAQAELDRVNAGAPAGEIEIAEAALEEAQAGLRLVELRIERMTLVAPVDGVVGEVLVSVGEMASAGAPLVEIHEITDLRLTVYVAETQIARLSVGDVVSVTVDAYPGETWEGRIARIADEAQFTPSNVQTVEERVKLVFAVEIALDEEAGRLKAGMPADVRFEQP